MEWFKYEKWQAVYIQFDGEISKHIIRGFYEKGNDKIYIILTYGRESLVKETELSETLNEAKGKAIYAYEEQIGEINRKIIAVQDIREIELTEERSPAEIAIEQKKLAEAKEEEERENQLAIDESNSDQEAEATDNN